jgi:hypothetical protein
MESFIDTPSKPNIKGPPSVKGDIKTEQFSMLSAIFDIKKSPTCNNRNIYLNISLFFGTIMTSHPLRNVFEAMMEKGQDSR